MNKFEQAETDAANLIRAEALFITRRYCIGSDEPAARIALLARALELEIIEQGGNPELYKFFTGEQE